MGCSCAVCRSQDTRDQRLRTSAFVEYKGVNFLIDAGPDLRQQLLRNNITRIDAILVTHEHKDHIGGLDDVRPVCFMMKSPVNIYGLPRVLDVIRKDYDYAFQSHPYPGVPSFALHPVPDKPFTIQNIEIIPVLVRHLTLPILGYRIGNIGYITDAIFISESELQKLKNLDVLVINALRKKRHYSHFNLTQALQLIDYLNPKSAYLTHISHELGRYVDVQPTLPSNVFLGEDGLTITTDGPAM